MLLCKYESGLQTMQKEVYYAENVDLYESG